MGKNEIIAELPKLQPHELAEIQARLHELAGEQWLDNGELSDVDKAALDTALANYADTALPSLFRAQAQRDSRNSRPSRIAS